MDASEKIFSQDHVWLRANQEGDFTLGISEFAQAQLGDIVFAELPSLGAMTEQGQSCAVIESVKAASDVICPISGEVVALNDALNDSPELINESPYEQGWIMRIKGDAKSLISGKMSADEYDRYLSENTEKEAE